MTVLSIKNSAKGLLKGYWLRSVTAVMLALAVSAIATILAEMALTLTETDFESAVGYGVLLFGSAAGTFLSAPIMLGYKRILWLRAEGKAPSLSDVLYLFGSAKALWRYVGLYLLRGVLVLLPAAVLSAPVMIYANIFEGSVDLNAPLNDVSPLVALTALGCLLLVLVGIGLSGLQALRYMLSDYIFVDKEDWGIFDLLHASSVICLKNSKLLINLFFSFFGWFLLNATGFGRLFTEPYYNAALACVAKELLAQVEPDDKVDNTADFDGTLGGEQA